MKLFATAAMTVAIGLAPLAGIAPALAADTTTSSNTSTDTSISLDLLSLTDFALNPSERTWNAVLQQLHAHPCYRAVNEELDWCRAQYGLSADIESLLQNRSAFMDWLTGQIVAIVCNNDESSIGCLSSIQLISEADWWNTGSGTTIDLTNATNEELFDEVGVLTTRQHAIEIIQERMDQRNVLSTHERATLLWNACADTDMGQSGCFQTYQRYVNDRSVDLETIRDVIRGNQ